MNTLKQPFLMRLMMLANFLPAIIGIAK